jgi:hypothetical protein
MLKYAYMHKYGLLFFAIGDYATENYVITQFKFVDVSQNTSHWHSLLTCLFLLDGVFAGWAEGVQKDPQSQPIPPVIGSG